MGDRRSLGRTAAALAALAVVGCAQGPFCEGEGLRDALAAARAGDVITVGACRVEGAFTLPAGVALVGVDATASGIVAPDGDTALDVVPSLGRNATRVEGLTLVHDGGFGIRAVGPGALRLRELTVRSERGVGIAVQGAQHVTFTDVDALGPIDAGSAVSLGDEPDARSTAVVGLLLVRVRLALLDGVGVVGFGGAGLLATESTLRWAGGAADANLGAGIHLDRATARLTGVTANDTLRGLAGWPSVGIAASDGALFAEDLEVIGSAEGVGVELERGEARFLGVRVGGHAGGGLVARDLAALSLRDVTLERNHGLAAQIVGGAAPELRDLTITDTRLAVGLPIGFTSVVTGDGLQLLRLPGAHLERVAVRGCERAGIVVDLSRGAAGLAFHEVEVRAEGDALGLVAVGGVAPLGWDEGVTRLGAAAANDDAFAGSLALSGPPSLEGAPSAELARRAREQGIDAVARPAD